MAQPGPLAAAVACASVLFAFLVWEMRWNAARRCAELRAGSSLAGGDPPPSGDQAHGGGRRLPPWDNERCLREMVAHVPIDDLGRVWPHQAFVLENGLWRKWAGDSREGPRFRNFTGLMNCGSCVVLLVGGNVECYDCDELYERYKCTVLVLEPVPAFHKQLSARYEGHPGIKTYAFGLGAVTRNISMDPDRVLGVQGMGTFVMDLGQAGAGAAGKDVLRILSPVDALRELGLASSPRVDLLHVNCEGCEWEMFSALHRSDLLRRFRVIQIQTHNYPRDYAFKGGIEGYCKFRKNLRETHHMSWGAPYTWERWLLRDFPVLPPAAAVDCPGDNAVLKTPVPVPPRAPRRRPGRPRRR
eukprot:TRINITY_DN1522_c0_g1_i1.p1 TRINITY_DN1522_c0_g1~~TRINITY_DN1522_c0_g1_i1.p1  ORF type:complete len:390 (+),score=97.36 TRINITY_DN1522_c0_g1_i1:100-1170(+)